MTLKEDICNCEVNVNARELNKEEMCKKICENILQGLLEGYEELLKKHPEKAGEFQPKIEEIKQQMQKRKISTKIKDVLSL